jgi:hypothetical protein
VKRLALLATLLASLFGAARPARAIEFRLWNEPLRLGIVESLFASYHGDLGPGLISEVDANGKPIVGSHFYNVLNKLNVDLTWRRLRFATRFDTAVFFDTPDGSCGPDASTKIALRSRFCQNPFYLEKISLEYSGRTFEATLGDFYVSFGRGIVLSIRKLDELGIDTTLRGAKLVYHQDNVSATLVAGFTNIQNVDEATGRYADDPSDFIAGAHAEYRFFDRLILGMNEVGGIQHTNASPGAQKEDDSYFMYGASLDAPRLARWLALYFEGAGQRLSLGDQRQTGYALYGFATGYFGPTAILVEFKDYKNYQPWHSSVPSSYVEFAPVGYLQPPTAERIVTELAATVFDVRGARLRVDWRMKPWLLSYASYAYFEDDSAPDQPLTFHDPYAGLEIRWNDGRSHLFPSGGYRIEMDRKTHREFQHIGHVEWDFTQDLPRGLSLETQGFVLFRQEELVTATRPNGSEYNPNWTEGTAYLALKWTPYIIAAAGYEWTTRPSDQAATKNFFNGSLQWNITTASSIRLFAGGNRGGIRCISGICRNFPAFTGARLEVVVRL